MRQAFCWSLIWLFSIAAFGQLPTSTLNGTVADPKGAVVAGAQVAITSNATGVTKQTSTDSNGVFSISNLNPGDYTVRVSATGFATSEYKGVHLDVGRASSLEVSLKIAKPGKVVEVTGAEVAVNTTQSEVQGVVSAPEMENLPQELSGIGIPGSGQSSGAKVRPHQDRDPRGFLSGGIRTRGEHHR